jgi:hypothetical protein
VSDKPMLFSAPMVRALLDGRKTQTRRVLRNPEYYGCPTGDCPHERQSECDFAMATLTAKETGYAVGDRLWVKETWRTESNHYDDLKPSDLGGEETVLYDADAAWGANKSTGRVRQSIFMPRWASRITLTVTDVRVQQLLDISEDDAIAEGIHRFDDGWHFERNPEPAFMRPVGIDPVKMYSVLWSIINGPGAWAANPWVVAISFEVARCNIDSTNLPQSTTLGHQNG